MSSPPILDLVAIDARSFKAASSEGQDLLLVFLYVSTRASVMGQSLRGAHDTTREQASLEFYNRHVIQWNNKSALFDLKNSHGKKGESFVDTL